MNLIKWVLLLVCLIATSCSQKSVITGYQYPLIEAPPNKYTIPYAIVVYPNFHEEAYRTIYSMELAEEYFYPLDIDFVLRGIYYYDAGICYSPTPDVLTIFLNPAQAMFLTPAGYGTFPGTGDPIIHMWGTQEPSTYGHEIGHTIGNLRHTFNEDDFVDDTPPDALLGRNSQNLMGYSFWPWYFQGLTEGQLERFRFYLLYSDRNSLIR
jgi:hypothetical protein